jgi:hypothetical protein
MTTLEHELEIALRAETPRPTQEFAEKLDRRVADDFPRSTRFKLPVAHLPAIAAGAAALVAVVLAVSLSGGNSKTNSSSSSAGASTAASEGASTAASGGASKVAPATRDNSPGFSARSAPSVPPTSRVRRVERSAELTLGAPSSKLDEVANQVVAVTDRHHGFVLHSSVTTGRGGSTGGSFVLRVPTGQVQSTLSDLSGLADVRSRTQNADDITQPYNAVAGQLAEARALRHSLLERLAKATTDTEVQALRHRIHLESAQIRSLGTRFSALQNRARLATIDVNLVRERTHHAAAGGVSGSFHDALHSLAVSFGIALRVLGVVLPLALVAALGWLAAGLLRRRRREAALL